MSEGEWEERFGSFNRRIADDLLDRVSDGVVDVIPEIALQLPIAVISEMLGVPESMWGDLQPWVRAATATLEINTSLEQMDAATAATHHLVDAFEELIEARRAAPTDDLLSMLIHVEESGDQLTHDELISTVLLLFGAGFETTTKLIGNGLLALLEHPDPLDRLRADRSLLPTAVEELLRWTARCRSTAESPSRTSTCTASRSKPATRSSRCSVRRTAIPGCSTSPTDSTSVEPRRG